MENVEILKNKIDKLDYAKKAVIFCLENENGNVDWHDIVYWAEEVKKLRTEIKEMI